MIVSNQRGVVTVVCVVGQSYSYDGEFNAMLTCRSHYPSHEVTSEAGLRQIKLTTSYLPHMSVAWPSLILRRSQMIGFMHAMIDQGIDDLVYRNSRSHVLPADMTRVRLRGRGY